MAQKLLIVVDMQHDFVVGTLGTNEAKAIIPNVVEKIVSWNGDIICTQDTHGSNYLNTLEGKKLPVEHCIDGTLGHQIHFEVENALKRAANVEKIGNIKKYSFGSLMLPEMIRFDNYEEIHVIGLCTDICVVSNALILKANFPETEIFVDASCCAGTTPEAHEAALRTMASCQINIV